MLLELLLCFSKDAISIKVQINVHVPIYESLGKLLLTLRIEVVYGIELKKINYCQVVYGIEL